jgi:uncharacterized UBP type Zn finger protein
MDEAEKKELVKELPACPFCGRKELLIRFYEEQYYDVELKLLVKRIQKEGMQVFCALCEEEIRPEDYK